MSSDFETSLSMSLSFASSSALSLKLYFSRNSIRQFFSNNFCFMLDTSSNSSSFSEWPYAWFTIVCELWTWFFTFRFTFKSALATWISLSSLFRDSRTWLVFSSSESYSMLFVRDAEALLRESPISELVMKPDVLEMDTDYELQLMELEFDCWSTVWNRCQLALGTDSGASDLLSSHFKPLLMNLTSWRLTRYLCAPYLFFWLFLTFWALKFSLLSFGSFNPRPTTTCDSIRLFY